jgi:ComF family protein
VRALVHGFKYEHRRELARYFARTIVAALPSEECFDLIVPVPLHWTRRIARGYNQSALLARAIGRSTRAPVALRVLVKRRRTADQTSLDIAARRRNVRTAFAVRKARAGFLSGLRVLLVDDVLTTGATAGACARVLREAGASRVFVAAIARTPLARPAGGEREPES